MRRYYYTEYRGKNGSNYSGYLLAEDRAEAEHLVVLRGLGEWIESEMEIQTRFHPILRVMAKPAVLLNRVRWDTEYQWKDVNKLLHQAMFLLHLGQCSGRYSPPYLFGDSDPLHELVHCLDMDKEDLTGALTTLTPWLEELGTTAPELFYTPQEVLQLKEQETLRESS